MFTKTLVYCFMQLLFVLKVDGISLTLIPQNMVIGSSTVNPGTSLTIQCSSSGTSEISKVFDLKLSRRKFTEPTFIGIASMDLPDQAKLDITVPIDIQQRSPNITGSFNTDYKSGAFTLTISTQGLTCADQAEFQCSMTYKDQEGNTHFVPDSGNFTVITVPSDVIMDSPEYYDGNGKTLQLNNNSVLDVGTRIKFRCTANVGSLPEGVIIWERSPEMGSMYSFIPYTPTQTTDIVQDDPSQQAGCFYSRTSTMYYNLTKLDDDGISFRCKARSYMDIQWYEALSKQQFRSFAAPTQTSTIFVETQSTMNASTSLTCRFATNRANTIILVILFLYQIMSSRFADGQLM